jgi:hypothetical protein
MRTAVRGRPWLDEKGRCAGGRSRDWRRLPVNRRLDRPGNPWISPGNALSAALTGLVRTPIAMRVRRVACPVLRPGGQFRFPAPPGPAASPSASQRVSCALSRRPVTGWCHGPDNRPGLAPRAGVTPPAPYADVTPPASGEGQRRPGCTRSRPGAGTSVTSPGPTRPGTRRHGLVRGHASFPPGREGSGRIARETGPYCAPFRDRDRPEKPVPFCHVIWMDPAARTRGVLR